MELKVKSPDRLIQEKEKYYRSNYRALMLEGFLFSFSLSIFSHTTVLPVYISQISTNSIFISLLAVVFFGLSYGSSIFSCILSANVKSAKWVTVYICAVQRIGLLLLFLSTYTANRSAVIALSVFFIAYAVYSIGAGLSSPVYSNMVSTVIYRNVSGFYGSYNLAGAVAGVLGAEVVKWLLENLYFPLNYRYLFLFGLITAISSLCIVAFFVKEVPREKTNLKLKFSDLSSLFKYIVKENQIFRSFICVRMCVAAAELAVPFYIIKTSMLDNIDVGFVGTLSMVFLISNMVFSKIFGYIGDKFGPFFLLRVGIFGGIGATWLILSIPSPIWGVFLFILVSITTSSVMLSTSIANIIYSSKGLVPIYTAISGICISPIYVIFSFLGGILAKYYSINWVFGTSLIIYCIALGLNYYFGKKYNLKF